MSPKLTAIATFLILAATGASSAFAAQECASGRGRAGSPVPQVFSDETSDRGTILGTRLLATFGVGYNRFSQDHHFGTLAIMPGRGEPGQPLVTFGDKNFDDYYESCITYLPYWGPFSYNFVEKSGCRGTCSASLSTPSGIADPVFVLQGFSVSYSQSDHHIEQLAITERGGVLTVALNDKNDDDPFSFEVDYAYIPRAQFSVVSDRKGVSQYWSSDKIEVGSAVIRGFELNFTHGDHHIGEIGVGLGGGGGIFTTFADESKNHARTSDASIDGEDQYRHTVEYGIIATRCWTRACPSRPFRWPLPVQPEVERPSGAAQ